MQQIKPEEFKNLTEAQQDAYLDALAQVTMREGRSQKFRTAAQGTTLGFADEAEARFKSGVLGEGTYEENVGDIRQKLKQYREDSPVESVAMEVAGATIPAFFSRGATAPTSLMNVAGRGLLEGAASGYGTAEGSLADQAAQTVTGAGAGGILGLGTHIGMSGISSLADGVVSTMRRLTGSKGATVVDNEIKRLAEQSGETPDEIVARIANGEIMADNKSLQMALRAYLREGGITESQIRKAIPERAESLRLEGVAALQQGLSPSSGSNVLKAVRMKEDDFKKSMSDAYKNVYNKVGSAPELADPLIEAVRRLPKAKEAIEDAYTSGAGNLVPFFKIGDDGAIEMLRAPTLEDAEIIRRVIDDSASDAFRNSRGTVGSNLASLESDLRRRIDEFSPELAQTRSQYRQMNVVRDQFEEGRKAFNKPPEQLEIDIEAIADNPQALSAFREGVMAQINNKMSRAGGKQLMRKLSDPQTLEGKLFQQVFPDGQMKREALRALSSAGAAQSTFEKVIEGSTTALTQRAGDNINLGVGMDEVISGMQGNPIALARVGTKVVKSMAPQLTDQQRKQVVDVLISEDPQFVLNAITDKGALAELQRKLNDILSRGTNVASTTGAITGGSLGAETLNRFMESE
jgi:hypothetical protein